MTRQERLAKSRYRPWHRIVSACILGLVLLAGCRPADGTEDASAREGPVIEPSTEAALRFVEKVSVASRQGIESGYVSLTVTQEELTSFLNIGSQISRQLQAVQPLQGSQLTADGLEQLDGIEGLEKWMNWLRSARGFPLCACPVLHFGSLSAMPRCALPSGVRSQCSGTCACCDGSSPCT